MDPKQLRQRLTSATTGVPYSADMAASLQEIAEEAVALLEGSVVLTFGDGTDNDTWTTIFHGLAPHDSDGYVVAINGIDYKMISVGGTGVLVRKWDDDFNEPEGLRIHIPWSDFYSLWIY